MDTSRGFLFITYKLYHHLNKLDGEHKSHCLNVFLSVMKYAWKKNGYEARLRHETIHKDTGLCRTTIKSCLSTLNKLNVVKSFRGKSGKTYIVNEVFLKAEKLFKIDVKHTQDSRFTPILEESIYYNNIDRIIGPLFGRWKINENDYIYHKTVFTKQKLEEILINSKYKNIKEWNPLEYFGSEVYLELMCSAQISIVKYVDYGFLNSIAHLVYDNSSPPPERRTPNFFDSR